MGFSKVSISIVSLFVLFCLGRAQSTPKDFVAAHNNVRTQLRLPPLDWNATVAAYAQKYANIRSADCNLEHSEGPYGENLAEGSWDLTAAEAVKMWADEKEFYNYASNSCVEGQMCGHYTQIVWRDSSSVGCAKAKCSNNGWTFVTCNYYPPGNYIGERPY